MNFKKKKKDKKLKKKSKVLTINPRKKIVFFLWLLLASSFTFAIYKHFTAIDTHTIHENTVVERELKDTNNIENFVRDFAQTYYTWNNNEEALEERENTLKDFVTEDLHSLNNIMLDNNTTTSSTAQNIQIWSIAQKSDTDFDVAFSVSQQVTQEGEEENQTLHSAFEVTIHVDAQENLVIIKNPTLTTFPTKSTYQPTPLESDNSLHSETREEIDEFLSSFFTLYPTASQSELSYYVEDGVLPLIDRDYTFSELIDPIYIQENEQVRALVTVRYQDNATQSNQLSQYDLLLTKNGTWKIVD